MVAFHQVNRFTPYLMIFLLTLCTLSSREKVARCSADPIPQRQGKNKERERFYGKPFSEMRLKTFTKVLGPQRSSLIFCDKLVEGLWKSRAKIGPDVLADLMDLSLLDYTQKKTRKK